MEATLTGLPNEFWYRQLVLGYKLKVQIIDFPRRRHASFGFGVGRQDKSNRPD